MALIFYLRRISMFGYKIVQINPKQTQFDNISYMNISKIRQCIFESIKIKYESAGKNMGKY